MDRLRQRTGRGWRQWLGLCLTLLLAFAPPLNLMGVDLALQAHAADGNAHHAHPDHRRGDDQSGSAHHTSANGCLQCLALGGMSLAGAAAGPQPAPQRHEIAFGWTCTPLISDSRGARMTVCRGPPTLV